MGFAALNPSYGLTPVVTALALTVGVGWVDPRT